MPSGQGGHPANVVMLTLRRVRGAAADLAPDPRPVRCITSLSGYNRQGGGDGKRGYGPEGDLQHLLRRTVSWCITRRSTRSCSAGGSPSTVPASGWSTPAGAGAAYGVGSRMKIGHTPRHDHGGAVGGARRRPVPRPIRSSNVEVPTQVPNVPAESLHPPRELERRRRL